MLQCKTPLKPYPVNSATYLEMSGQIEWMQLDAGGEKNPEFLFPSLTGIPYKTLGHGHEAICI